MSAPAPAATPSPTAAAAVELLIRQDPEDANARTAELRVGQLVQLELETCGGCGYEWRLVSAPATAIVAEEQVSPSEGPPPSGPPIVGAATIKRIAFRGKATGKTTLEVAYYGPAKATPDRKVVVYITVT